MIRFKDENKEKHLFEAKEMIEEMDGKVPSLLSVKCGINFAREDRAMDLCLIAEFADRNGLHEYAVHPEHLKVIDYIKKFADYSKVVDYETVQD
jgi:hypothetical protein